MANRTGQQLGNYTLVQLLGRGGQAEVYLGEHRYLKSEAALKVLHASLDDQHSAQFLSEAQTLARLVHPSIVRVLDFTVEQGTPVLIMDYAPEGTMRQRYPPGTRVPLATVVSTASQVASALQYAHTHSVIHRDVKPENILLGAQDQVLLSDFGLSVVAPSPELLSTQAMAGTLPYMAPEQLQGHPCFASDQYSLALVAYEWLCGRRPFTGSQWQLIQQQLYAAPPALRELNPAVPAAVEAVLLRALAKEPGERYVSVQGFALALERASQHVQAAREDTQGTAPLRLSRTAQQDEAGTPFSQSTQPLPALAPSVMMQDTVTREELAAAFTQGEGKGERALTASPDVNRQRFLAKVRAFWISGVLEHSLHGAALIALGLREQQGAVANPWHLVMEAPGEPGRAVPPGTSIVQVYDEAVGELLILGEPGSGKTTLLLELARSLLDRAQRDERHPLPVIFNLSSWAVKRQPLTEWLIEELNTKYQVPRKLGNAWVEADQILPLLDGLDEVASTARSACVEAINVYRLRHGLVPTVVCSRSAGYMAQAVHVLLRKAIVVQPLTTQQIEDYLASTGEPLASVRTALQADPALRELATTPLMLSVLSLAYQGTSAEELLVAGPPDVRRRHIFEHYVERMLSRRGTAASYSPEQTRGWLAWLARQLKQQNQTVFYIEHLQPRWISSHQMCLVYDRWAVQFPAILMGMLASLALSTFLFSLIAFTSLSNLVTSLPPYIILGGFIGWLLGTGRTMQQLHQSSGKARKGSWSRLVEWLRTGGLIGLLVGLSDGLSEERFYGLRAGLIVGLSDLLIVGLGSILLQVVLEKSNTTASNLQGPQRSQQPKRQHLMKSADVKNGILIGLLLGLSIGLSVELGYGLSAWLSIELDYGLSAGLSVGVLIGLLAGLSFGLSGGLLSVLLIGKPVGITLTDKLIWSWRSLGRSLLAKKHMNTTVRVMALVVLSIGLLAALLAGLSTGLLAGLLELSVGLSFWLLFGLFGGVSSETIEDHHRVVPNQGIHRSARNSLALGLISTAIVWLVCGLGVGLSNGLAYGYVGYIYGLINGLIIGLSAGLLAGLLNGGLACLRHSMVRLLLWRSRAIPWNYPRFLDSAAERILLRKVGGGYIFVHRLLLEYFASLDTTPQPQSTRLIRERIIASPPCSSSPPDAAAKPPTPREVLPLLCGQCLESPSGWLTGCMHFAKPCRVEQMR
jgi:tRNA A-37 threonylcarbamoyl transferase component Bud32/DNA polymerase III delta prime subunit/MFS family permease